MAKILLGLLSAHHPSRWGYRARAREQFLKNSPLPHVFVLGNPFSPNMEENDTHKDILFAKCDDRKESMVLKNQALFRYALENGFDYCFRACDDTWIFPERILKAGFEEFDYAGQMPCKFSLGGTFKIWMRYFDYMHGGTGIWLSRKSMEMLVKDEWDPNRLLSWPSLLDVGMGLMLSRPPVYWDDHWIGEVLKGNLPFDSPRREHPAIAYAENGISIYEDDLMFYNDDYDRPVSVHDPGVRKPQSWQAVAIMERIKEWKGKAFGNLKITEEVDAER